MTLMTLKIKQKVVSPEISGLEDRHFFLEMFYNRILFHDFKLLLHNNLKQLERIFRTTCHSFTETEFLKNSLFKKKTIPLWYTLLQKNGDKIQIKGNHEKKLEISSLKDE